MHCGPDDNALSLDSVVMNNPLVTTLIHYLPMTDYVRLSMCSSTLRSLLLDNDVLKTYVHARCACDVSEHLVLWPVVTGSSTMSPVLSFDAPQPNCAAPNARHPWWAALVASESALPDDIEERISAFLSSDMLQLASARSREPHYVLRCYRGNVIMTANFATGGNPYSNRQSDSDNNWLAIGHEEEDEEDGDFVNETIVASDADEEQSEPTTTTLALEDGANDDLIPQATDGEDPHLDFSAYEQEKDEEASENEEGDDGDDDDATRQIGDDPAPEQPQPRCDQGSHSSVRGPNQLAIASQVYRCLMQAARLCCGRAFVRCLAALDSLDHHLVDLVQDRNQKLPRDNLELSQRVCLSKLAMVESEDFNTITNQIANHQCSLVPFYETLHNLFPARLFADTLSFSSPECPSAVGLALAVQRSGVIAHRQIVAGIDATNRQKTRTVSDAVDQADAAMDDIVRLQMASINSNLHTSRNFADMWLAHRALGCLASTEGDEAHWHWTHNQEEEEEDEDDEEDEEDEEGDRNMADLFARMRRRKLTGSQDTTPQDAARGCEQLVRLVTHLFCRSKLVETGSKCTQMLMATALSNNANAMHGANLVGACVMECVCGGNCGEMVATGKTNEKDGVVHGGINVASMGMLFMGLGLVLAKATCRMLSLGHVGATRQLLDLVQSYAVSLIGNGLQGKPRSADVLLDSMRRSIVVHIVSAHPNVDILPNLVQTIADTAPVLEERRSKDNFLAWWLLALDGSKKEIMVFMTNFFNWACVPSIDCLALSMHESYRRLGLCAEMCHSISRALAPRRHPWTKLYAKWARHFERHANLLKYSYPDPNDDDDSDAQEDVGVVGNAQTMQ
ncbi:hypothetical protein ml_457 [Mollivirus sibericum]|uniref:hypothetical protein n=1 Tax=Mollivirus sibericum TaxID=1678078 RepID=UPI0006B2EB1F|nr:hypothetical protein ml_457 [Mollivirus sibericum]ALD62259.1 hypothetical protein ml_457 [Mollivirus sibericum]